MLDFLFGEGQYGLRFLFAFVVVLGLIGLTAWLVRRFGSERLGAGTARGRQPRLAVIDAATVDGRRRLILIRRDNVEHLLMIGGPTDVVIEPNIVRTAMPREAAPQRPPAAAPDPLPRAVPLGEGSLWPLQPEPAPIPSPAPRQQRQAPPVVEEPMQWHAEPEPPPPMPPRQPRPLVDPLAGLAAELSRQPPANMPPPRQPREREPAREREPVREREALREREPARSPQPQPAAAADGQFASSADANLAEMAQRLEAALRRTPKADALPPEPKLKVPPPPPAPELEPPPPAQAQSEPMIPAEPKPMPPPAAVDAKPPRSDAKPAREGKSAPQKSSLYDSLEQEMASLLGRPNKT